MNGGYWWQSEPIQWFSWDCDMSRGDTQCPAKLAMSDGYLNCRFKVGHPGPHKTSYNDGTEWEVKG